MKVVVGNDFDEFFFWVYNWNIVDFIFCYQFMGVLYQGIFCECQWVEDYFVFGMFYFVYFYCLVGNGYVFMNYFDFFLLGDGNGQVGFCYGIYGSRNDGYIDFDVV